MAALGEEGDCRNLPGHWLRRFPDASRPRSERSSPSPPLRRSGWLYWPEDYRIDPELRWGQFDGG